MDQFLIQTRVRAIVYVSCWGLNWGSSLLYFFFFLCIAYWKAKLASVCVFLFCLFKVFRTVLALNFNNRGELVNVSGYVNYPIVCVLDTFI